MFEFRRIYAALVLDINCACLKMRYNGDQDSQIANRATPPFISEVGSDDHVNRIARDRAREFGKGHRPYCNFYWYGWRTGQGCAPSESIDQRGRRSRGTK